MFQPCKLFVSLLCLCIVDGYAHVEIPPCISDGTVEKPIFFPYRGSRGKKGDRGKRGPRGIPGIRGVIGLQGPTGSHGRKGKKGPHGVQGIQGNTGPTGKTVAGPEGLLGNTGPRGSGVFGYASYPVSSTGAGVPVPSPVQITSDLVDGTGVTFAPATYSFTVTQAGTYAISYCLRGYYQTTAPTTAHDTCAISITGTQYGTTELIPVQIQPSSPVIYVSSGTRQIVLGITAVPATVSLVCTNITNTLVWKTFGSVTDIGAYLSVQQLSTSQPTS